eukprot:TRINITY_DN11060_c0_g1_i3.p1 TRINITY_DN11060_c0_g1~~TRINITY_DN11060_c0_g1_i3.p1  ORF type:complete len:196 (+),score=37.17 TRINITY_DN11060_c0_g1_i3:83-670(+)
MLHCRLRVLRASIMHLVWLPHRHPDLFRERLHSLADPSTVWWDRPLVAVFFFLATFIPLVAAVDLAHHWSPFSFPTVARAAAMLGGAAFQVLAIWTLHINAFASSCVRIQRERGQTVIINGPYAHVRHPFYLGMILGTLSVPVLLDSVVALCYSVLCVGLLVWRTALEDEVLKRDLQGYRAYTTRVVFRLVPWVW